MSVTPTRAGIRTPDTTIIDSAELACLDALQKKILWLASWTIHHANHIRESRDGLKVGGHQASCASMVQIMTALYFHTLRPEDRVAVKPHASPVFHAIQYLLGRQDREQLELFRALGGAQSYPSRTKDKDDVDFSTGSVGLGVATTAFAALVQDYLKLRDMLPQDQKPGRMVALVGDAELDEGNVWEALLESWKHNIGNVWWVVDYNRQSLDSVVSDRLFQRIQGFFDAVGWEVVTVKYGKLLTAAFEQPGGEALRDWINECPNELYSALCFKGGASWREHLERDFKKGSATRKMVDACDDEALHRLMTNLAGHDLESLIEAFDAAAAADDDRPRCFICYTIKGHGLPFAGHKDNHSGLMNPQQVDGFRETLGIAEGEEWEPFSGLEEQCGDLQDFLKDVPFAQEYPRRRTADAVPVPDSLTFKRDARVSTQQAFGNILNEIGRSDAQIAEHIVTTSPDVAVSTNLGPWINRRGLFDRREHTDTFKSEKVISAQSWDISQTGQHIELGIAENNLFLMLSAMGLSHSLFGKRLLPIGTLYDPFISRGLDAMNYACYQDSRFMLVATPSGVTLAPEGGAHQSIYTPLIGMGQPGLTSFEPAFADELAEIMRWGFEHMQADEGGSVYLRLSTRPIDQVARELDDTLRADILSGGYWLREPSADADIAIIAIGTMAPEALAAHETLVEDIPGAGLLVATSADRLMADWHHARRHRRAGMPAEPSHVERLLSRLPSHTGLVTVLDGHPATLSWMGGVRRHRIQSLGVEDFGRSADIPDIHAVHGIDADSILDAAARLCLTG
ncbi:MAG: transketolase [Rhodospirillaceae bacterium]|nr:transketolase [Rhodospirillaceae bacterium]